MSWPALKWALDTPARGVPQHVLVMLAKYHNKDTGQCNPSVAELAQATGLGATTVRRAIRALEDDGLVVVKDNTGGRQQRARYILTGPDLAVDTRPQRPSKGRVKTRSDRPGEGAETSSERPSSEAETRPERHSNSVAAADVVLRTRTGTSEPGTTGIAAAPPTPSGDALFDVEPPVVAGRELTAVSSTDVAKPEPVVNGSHAVAVWCEAYAAAFDAAPTKDECSQVGKEAKALLTAGNPPDRVLIAARSAGGRGFATVRREYRDLAKRSGQALTGPRRPSATTRATTEAQSLKDLFPQGESA